MPCSEHSTTLKAFCLPALQPHESTCKEASSPYKLKPAAAEAVHNLPSCKISPCWAHPPAQYLLSFLLDVLTHAPLEERVTRGC